MAKRKQKKDNKNKFKPVGNHNECKQTKLSS